MRKSEEEIRQLVTEFLADKDFQYKITKCECESEYEEDNYWIVYVEVDRKDYRKANLLDSFLESLSLNFNQKQPELLHAEVGDLVLIYDDYQSENEESDLGLVSSKYIRENGVIYYGCRYIKVGLHDSFVNSMYDFEITAENYGGYKDGFLAILNEQQAIAHLSNQLISAHKAEVSNAKQRFENSTRNLPGLVEKLMDVRKNKLKCEKIELTELPYYLENKTLFEGRR
jgi:hypothetical protein